MKLFLKEHLGLIFVYILNFVLIMSLYFIFDGFSNLKNLYYFIFLSLFIFIVYMSIHYFKNKSIYRILNRKKVNSFEEILDSFDNSYLGKHMNIFVEELYSIYQYNLHSNIKKQKEHLDFINRWVHQMKTPIAVINLVLQQYQGEQHTEEIKSEVDKLQRGLDIALYNARLESFEHDFSIKEFNLGGIIKDTVNSLKRYFINSRIFPRIDIEEGLIVKSDRKWIRFILEQIIINAIKYSKDKGNYVLIKSYRDDNKVIVEIKDEGIGITRKDIRRIFEPFYTGENGRVWGESTGMGLYLVREVIRKLDHNIEVHSEENEGTTVNIIF